MRRMVLAQQFRGVADLPLARQKQQDIARPFTRQLIHGIQYGLTAIPVLLVLIVAAQGPVTHLHRIGAPAHLNDGGVVEVLREALGIDGRRGDDQLQIGTFGQQMRCR